MSGTGASRLLGLLLGRPETILPRGIQLSGHSPANNVENVQEFRYLNHSGIRMR